MTFGTFYLTTHEPGWLGRADFPLCVSRQRLWRGGRSVPEARAPWMLDSGAYMTVRKHGGWPLTARQWAQVIRKAMEVIGNVDWAAPMDMPCEDEVRAATGMTIRQHQEFSVRSYLDLMEIDDSLPVWPVLQGTTPQEYAECADMLECAGVRLARCLHVGVGGLCRLQDSDLGGQILGQLAPLGLRLHGFGFKKLGLLRYGDHLATADSRAGSYNARKNPPLPGCAHAHCTNCFRRAVWWRDDLLRKMEEKCRTTTSTGR